MLVDRRTQSTGSRRRLSHIATDHTAATVPSTDAPMKFALLLLTACAMFARADRDRLPLLPLLRRRTALSTTLAQGSTMLS